jgi:hypothetical protein
MKYRKPRIFRWRWGCVGIWPEKLWNGRPVVGVKDTPYAFYLLWLQGY